MSNKIDLDSIVIINNVEYIVKAISEHEDNLGLDLVLYQVGTN